MTEEWRPIAGYEGLYEVSSLGRVRSIERVDCSGRKRPSIILTPLQVARGYLAVKLSKDSIARMYRINRLVAIAFLPNPEMKQEVNHISEDKTDNRVENLCWATSKENINWGTRTARAVIAAKRTAQKRAKVTVQMSASGDVIKEFPSIREAERITGIHRRAISRCCSNYKYTAGGFHWRYKTK